MQSSDDFQPSHPARCEKSKCTKTGVARDWVASPATLGLKMTAPSGAALGFRMHRGSPLMDPKISGNCSSSTASLFRGSYGVQQKTASSDIRVQTQTHCGCSGNRVDSASFQSSRRLLQTGATGSAGLTSAQLWRRHCGRHLLHLNTYCVGPQNDTLWLAET